MTRRTYSRAERLSAVFLARQASIAEAAAVLGIPSRNVERWSAGEVELPADQWAAIEAVLLAKVADLTARGSTKGLVALSTAAGIAGRNVRYSTLIARREARVAPETEPANPIAAAIDALRPDQHELLHTELRLAIHYRRSEPTEPTPPESESEARILAGIAAMAELSESEVAERLAVSKAELEAEETRGIVVLEDATGHIRVEQDGREIMSMPSAANLPPAFRRLPRITESPRADLARPTPDPALAAKDAPGAALTVLERPALREVYSEPTLWRPLTRFDP